MNQYIDFTVLKPFASIEEILKGYETCKKHDYYGYCFPSFALPKLYEKITITEYKKVNDLIGVSFRKPEQTIKLITVVGFPLGYQSIQEKVQSILSLKEFPPHEIDFVINFSAVKSKDWYYLNEELHAIADTAKKIKIPIALSDRENFLPSVFSNKPLILKAIIESPHWDNKTLEKICFLCIANGIDFIKTSTGFLEEGITMEQKFASIKTIKEITEGSPIKIKLSGGVKTKEIAQKAIEELGIHRIGTSSIL